VAGVAALCLSVNPNLSPTELQDVLTLSADDLGPEGRDPGYGWGRLNAGRAVLLAQGDDAGLDVTAPSVVVTGPADAATVSGVVTVSASASDDGGVGCVHFSINGTAAAQDASAPYSFDWDTRLVLDGVYTLTATAQDLAGNQSSHSIKVTVKNKTDGEAPEVTITKPTDGTSVTSTVYVYVDARDNVGVTRVDLYVDGTLKAYSSVAPFTTTWNARYAAAGPHKLQVKARDADGNYGWSQVVTVNR
jgi:hypothetical protein